MKRLLLSLAAALSVSASAKQVWVEAESFSNPGGWVLDTQFIDIMGSPYLMAHGMGKAVKDAETEASLPAGTYTVWVRTKNWVAPFGVTAEAPGRFQVSVDGARLDKILGTEGRDWTWEKAGQARVKSGKVKLGLHDLTGFDGRVDAVLFSSDEGFTPPADLAATNQLRRKLLGLPGKAPETQEYDLVVVGGGYIGLEMGTVYAALGSKVTVVELTAGLLPGADRIVRAYGDGFEAILRHA